MSGNQYLFLFTIGPVQSFIAQARKTRDLYAGSIKALLYDEELRLVLSNLEVKYQSYICTLCLNQSFL